MPTYKGNCHCKSLTVEFRTEWKVAQDFPLRSCQCSFCTRHGARTARDPKGELTLFGQPHWYRFGLGTADFLLCPKCGVYMAAVVSHPEAGEFATLNVNCLEVAESFTQPAKPVSYSEESAEERIERRISSWTPFSHEPIPTQPNEPSASQG